MKYLAALSFVMLGLLSVAIADKARDVHWRLYKAMHKKVYRDPVEEAMRKDIFLNNREQIQKHNAEAAAKMGYRKGLSHLSDWTPEELSGLNGFLMNYAEQNLVSQTEPPQFVKEMMAFDVRELPKEVDWRKDGNRVTDVKDQGHCGSCWAFATTGVLEGQQVKTNATNGNLVPLSEQNVIDCSVRNQRCSGGYMSTALDDIADEHGIECEKDYPYLDIHGLVPQQCKFNKTKSVMNIRGAHVLERHEDLLQKVVAKFGPVAVAIHATPNLIQYKSGVLNDNTCDPNYINHAVLVVGYGTDPDGGDFWIIKNSWSTTWGDLGYFKLARNKGNMCGVASIATIPVLFDN